MIKTVLRLIRRIAGFDAKGMVSLVLWARRRRHGVPPGAVQISYAKEQTGTSAILLIVMAVETVAVDVLLRAIGAPEAIRLPVLLLDLYGLLIGLAVNAACVTRPHVVTATELRLRYGAFFDVRVPRSRIAAVRLSRNYNESGMVAVSGDRLAVVVSSQTNVVVELTEPITIIRPLGRPAEVGSIRFFADDPAAAFAALNSRTSSPAA
ncbi:hypothetical protein Aph01nite_67650 [Acrocarpospora phusangensis]|uniref:Uncharacterized protein n=1 Tax=Acrocarpospora phusangensis TaxID=1070424 RepID=A0A919QJ98_9ACTN|nr:hypothetical protein [Acrocarpospora phusangensis]GIH28455.1 hypothetical protein Aph01nite_67650 [Acrocarpospora phusangensis]